jgi:xanthine/CO dehydrogenase XdhC/CoxF family maturation factor/CTP:molybdopterin cytidylyltransferase MocA
MSRVLGIVLAAGRSERMGRPKPLLPHGERSFLRAAVETLADGGCAMVAVVVASREAELEARSAGAAVVWNDATASEQVDSLRLGLGAADDVVTGALVLPVDHPLVAMATVDALLAAHAARPDAIVRPTRGGRPGHPTLFPRSVWPALLDADLPAGARSLVEDPTTETLDVPVEDDGVLADVDTPSAYERYLGSSPPSSPPSSPRVGLIAAARAALSARAGGRPVAVVARVDEAGDDRRVLVHGAGDARGTLGDPALDAAARALGETLLGGAAPAARIADGAAPLGDAGLAARIAEGAAPTARTATVDDVPGALLYGEAHRPPARLFVVGAGHIALPLARMGVMLGFALVVLDDREEFATEVRFPDASQVLRVDFADPFAALPPGPEDYVVLVTRAHRYDFDCLLRLVDNDRPPRYIGMVGSRRRVRAAFRALLDAGVPAERLASIHAPIGVDIGAETPEEIAVSIAAELVAVRRGATPGGSLGQRERIVEKLVDATSTSTSTSEPGGRSPKSTSNSKSNRNNQNA